MSHHLGDRAGAYVDRVLDPAEMAAARAHLAACPACRDRVAEQERVREVLRASAAGSAAPPPALLAALASMPEAGPPVAPAPPGVRRAVVARRAAVSCVALGATVLATAYVVGTPVTAAGAPAVPPSRLAVQHQSTAGELPFWGAATVTAAAAATVEPAAKARHRDRPRSHDQLSRWVTRDPSAILRRAAAASASISYRAVEQVTTVDGTTPVTKVAEVSHLAGHGTSTQVLASSGAASGSALQSAFQPQVVGDVSSSLDAVSMLERSYTIRAEGVDVVAGRRVDRLAVEGDDGQVVARFWIDRASGLPLAREVQTPDGVSTGHRMTAVSLAAGSAMPVHLPVATSAVWGEAVGIPAEAALEVLDDEGWVCPLGLGAAIGLKPFDVLITDADASASKGQVLHIIYTDGLRSLSVFQQRATLSPQRLGGFHLAEVAGASVYRRDTQPTEITWAADGTVFTVVGDVPEPLLDTAVAALPHDRDDSAARTVRGLARVGSWIDPFE